MLYLVTTLLRSRLGITSTVLLFLITVAFVLQPLIGTLGYESALGMTLPVSVVAAAFGIRSGRLIAYDGADAPPSSVRTPFHQWLGVSLAALGALAPSFALLCLSAAWQPQCDFYAALAWWGLLPGMALALSAAIGLLLSRLLPGRERLAALAFVGMIVFSVSRAIWRGIDTPIVIAHSHFFGYVGGPIYDEVLHIPDSLLYLRIFTAALIATILFVLWAVESRQRAVGVVAAACALAAALLSANRKTVGIDLGRAEIQQELGGRIETEHFVIIWDRNGGLRDDQMDDVVDDHEYRYAQLQRMFHLTSPKKVTSYVFANDDRKAALMGAKHTQIANPFRREIYIGYEEPPIRVLKHEMVHATSEEFGGPIGASIKLGLVEGVAEAGDWTSSGDRNPHRESAAMLADGQLTPARKLIGWTFYLQRQANAYTAAGSFVRYLIDTYGVDEFRQAYGWGRFEKVYGKSIDTLDAEWRAYLGTIALDEGERLRAKERFAAPSIFEVPCARKAADLEERAWAHWASGRYARAEQLFTELADINEGPKPWRGLMFTYIQMGNLELARDALDAWQSRESEGSAGWFEAQAYRGDLEWHAGHLDRAEAAFRLVYDKHLSPYWDRRLALGMLVLPDAELRDDIHILWSGGRAAEAARLRLALADRSGPAGAAADYLLGRHFLQAHQPTLALRYLWAADQPTLTDPATLAELYLMTGRALYEERHLDEATEVFSKIQQLTGARPEQVGWATDWIERSKWKAAQPK